jgi:hypothetical protein
MAENSQSGAVRIPNNGDLLHIYVIDQGFNMRYQGSPRLQKASVSIPNRLSLPPVCGGGEIQIMYPIHHPVRVLKIHGQPASHKVKSIICRERSANVIAVYTT